MVNDPCLCRGDGLLHFWLNDGPRETQLWHATLPLMERVGSARYDYMFMSDYSEGCETQFKVNLTLKIKMKKKTTTL